MTRKLNIMIVAGEASGDKHSANLVQSLSEAEPAVAMNFFGSAGPKMREVGVDPVVYSDELSVIGVVEILTALPMFLKAYRKLKLSAIERKPDVVILVDFPDFNLRFAKWCKKQGLTVVYYISPQLWAWRKYRISVIKKYVDLLLTILPFEKAWYCDNEVHHVEYVGNPLAREVSATLSREDLCKSIGLDSRRGIVALLPGSRHKEIVRILPVLIDGAWEMSKQNPDLQFIIAISKGKNRVDVDRAINESAACPSSLTVVENDTYNAVAASDVAAVTSGTATLETGILGTPMVIVYSTSVLNYLLLKPLISVEFYGLVNLIAGEKVARELIQREFSSEAVSRELFEILRPENNALMRKRLAVVNEKVGSAGASDRAAAAILRLIGARSPRS